MSESVIRLCKTEGCSNLAAPRRTICYKCKTAAHRERHPIKYAYDMLKRSAKRRNYEFGLTLSFFTDFVKATGYMEGKGRLFDSLTIDRKKNHLGYLPDNIEVITKSANSQKYHQQDKQIQQP